MHSTASAWSFRASGTIWNQSVDSNLRKEINY